MRDKFKRGDIVVCTRTTTALTSFMGKPGNPYKVLEGENWGTISIKDEGGTTDMFVAADRFRKWQTGDRPFFEAGGQLPEFPPTPMMNPRDALKSRLLGHRDRIAADLGIATEFVTISVAYNASV